MTDTRSRRSFLARILSSAAGAWVALGGLFQGHSRAEECAATEEGAPAKKKKKKKKDKKTPGPAKKYGGPPTTKYGGPPTTKYGGPPTTKYGGPPGSP